MFTAVWLTLKRDDIPMADLQQRYEMQASRYLDLPNGVRAHYVDVGPRQAKHTLVLVHGFAASSHTWRDWMIALEKDYRVIALDLPCHGLTAAPADYHPDLPAYADHIAAIVDALELDSFVLAGSSMGGVAAWTYALDHPDRLDALVLVAAGGWEADDAERQANPLASEFLTNQWLRPVLERIDMTSVINDTLIASFADDELVTEVMVRRYSDLSRGPGHRRGLFDLQVAPHHAADPGALAKLDTPVLILQGEKDLLVPPRFARLFDAALPNSELIMYEGVGHLPQEEIPHRSASDVQRFLTERLAEET